MDNTVASFRQRYPHRPGVQTQTVVDGKHHRCRRDEHQLHTCFRDGATPKAVSIGSPHISGIDTNDNTFLCLECTINGFHEDSRTSSLGIEPAIDEPAQPSSSHYRSSQADRRPRWFRTCFQPCGGHRASRPRWRPRQRNRHRLSMYITP